MTGDKIKDMKDNEDFIQVGYSRIFGVDEHNRPVRRSKQEYPYSYDGFVTYRNGKNEEINFTVYTDRIDRDPKYDELSQKHFGNQGQIWFNRSPLEIQSFLRDLYSDPKLKLILVMEYCNVSSGYPLWRLDVKATIK